MSRAEKFIQEHTKALKESNGKEYFMWITPDQARKAVEIAREEMIEKACKWLEDNAIEYWGTEAVDNGMMIIDFKQAMKHETQNL